MAELPLPGTLEEFMKKFTENIKKFPVIGVLLYFASDKNTAEEIRSNLDELGIITGSRILIFTPSRDIYLPPDERVGEPKNGRKLVAQIIDAFKDVHNTDMPCILFISDFEKRKAVKYTFAEVHRGDVPNLGKLEIVEFFRKLADIVAKLDADHPENMNDRSWVLEEISKNLDWKNRMKNVLLDIKLKNIGSFLQELLKLVPH